MNLNFNFLGRHYMVSLISLLKEVQIVPVNNFMADDDTFKMGFPERISERIEIHFILKIQIENSIWTIPYTVVQTKQFDDCAYEYCGTHEYGACVEFLWKNKENDIFMFSRCRTMGIPYFEIEYQDNFEVFIHLLFLINSNSAYAIKNNDYRNIDNMSIWGMNEIASLSIDSNSYFIVRFKDVPNRKKMLLNNDYPNPYVNFERTNTFPDELIIEQESFFSDKMSSHMRGTVVFNILPKKYSNWWTGVDVLFAGSYGQCNEIFHDKEKLNKLRFKLYKDEEEKSKRINSNSRWNAISAVDDEYQQTSDEC